MKRVFSIGVPVVLAMSLTGCCRRLYCDGMRELRVQIAVGYAMCCQMPTPEQQGACLGTLNTNIQTAMAKASEARQACEAGNDSLARDLVKQIRDLFAPKVKLTTTPVGQTRVVNTWVVFGDRDWIAASVPACLAPEADCKPMTVAEVAGRRYNPEATGKAVESAAAAGQPATVIVVPATAAGAIQSCKYTIAPDATMRVRFGAGPTPVGVGGTFELADLQAAPNGKSALPSGVDLTLSAGGADITLTLDKTSPYNQLLAGADGRGTLSVALTMDSKSSALASCIYMGGTFFFEFPVHVSEDFRCVTLNMVQETPGSQYTPVEPALLIAADGPGNGGITNTPCADNNGNGLRDGADEAIQAMLSQLAGYCDETRH